LDANRPLPAAPDAERSASQPSTALEGTRMIKAIFWDNDGVLVDTERLYFHATQHVLATVGILLTKEQYIALFLVQGKGAWHLAAEKGISPSH
jgi:hypothetical protein